MQGFESSMMKVSGTDSGIYYLGVCNDAKMAQRQLPDISVPESESESFICNIIHHTSQIKKYTKQINAK